jgi:hypothetical protein
MSRGKLPGSTSLQEDNMNGVFCISQALVLCFCVALFKHYYDGKTEEVDFPIEETFTRYAKLLCAVSAGRFTLGHYHMNPAEQPDFATKALCRFLSPSQDDHENLYWRLLPISVDDIEKWSGPLANQKDEDLIALTDACGNIITFDYHTRADAEVVMERAKLSTPSCGSGGAMTTKEDFSARYGVNPLCKESREPVTDYPLSKEEVRILALHWAEFRFNNSTWCTLSGTVGSTELGIMDYTKRRWLAATSVLGEEAMDAVYDEAWSHIQKNPGKEV